MKKRHVGIAIVIAAVVLAVGMSVAALALTAASNTKVIYAAVSKSTGEMDRIGADRQALQQ
jgi:hypothetical protein